MDEQKEAEICRNDLRKTLPLITAVQTYKWKGYAGLTRLQAVDKYMADIGANIFPKRERDRLQKFLENKTDKISARTLTVLLATFDTGIETFLPSVKVNHRPVPKGAEAFEYAPDYFRALFLVTGE